jgi:two-component system OmpR family sensor kinase
VRGVLADLVVQLLLAGAACLLVFALDQGHVVVERAMAVLALTAGVSASVLLMVGAWLSGERRARRTALAIGVLTVATVVPALEIDARRGLWSSVVTVSVAAFAVLLLTASQRDDVPWWQGRLVSVGAPVLVATVLVAATVVELSGTAARPPVALAATADLLAWALAGGAGVAAFVAGGLTGHALPRRVGLAVATLTCANGIRLMAEFGSDPAARLVEALELAALLTLLVAAGSYLVRSVLHLWNEQEEARSRLAEAEAAAASAAELRHEVANAVAGLSGAAHVLRSDDASIGPDDGRRLLVAAGAELDRLQRMLQRTGDVPHESPTTDVVSVLRDLADVHRAGGLDVEVVASDVAPAGIHDGELRQVVTNLLVNCRVHAPGARVVLRVSAAGPFVRIDVADDGPGAADDPAELLARGVRGADSPGSGLGLSICRDLVRRCGGTITVAGGQGFTVSVDLPLAAVPVLAAGDVA